MKILYLHGLQGELTEEKRLVLTEFGDVISPKLDYASDSQIINTLYRQFRFEQIDVVVGTSMGGFAGYYLSLLLDASCLIFNPALPKRSVEQEIPEKLPHRNKYLQVVLGAKDETVDPLRNLVFLSWNLKSGIDARIHLLNQLGHRIPLPIFNKEVKFFFINI